MRISDLGEGALIRRIRDKFSESAARLGIGDDAAVVDIPPGHSVIYCSDLVAENTHFIRGLHPPDSIGYKAVAVNVSDVAAMGGTAMFFTLSIALPGDVELDWVDSFLDGIAKACRDFKVGLVGGDSSSAERIFVDVSMVGRVKKANEVRRSGAKPGDGIYVTGSLGGSSLGLEKLKLGDLKHPSVRRHLYPTPRHVVGRSVRAKAHSMIDISDGLSTDLSHIIEESKVSARIYKNLIPATAGASEEQVLHGGEEYELLIIAPDLPGEIECVPVTRIGEIIPTALEPQIFLIDGAKESVLQAEGYQHFQ